MKAETCSMLLVCVLVIVVIDLPARRLLGPARAALPHSCLCACACNSERGASAPSAACLVVPSPSVLSILSSHSINTLITLPLSPLASLLNRRRHRGDAFATIARSAAPWEGGIVVRRRKRKQDHACCCSTFIFFSFSGSDRVDVEEET